ncbi:nucleotide-binding protein [Oscillospiraceae bacterium LTW-04]|nr:ATP-binding protein [Oscillospiraceae bacterium MB24-C1]
MRIAVLSGKGGTGKTLVSVNLACAAEKATYIDCDVEAPNGHLFLKPQNLKTQPVSVIVPQVDSSKCTACRRCVDFCRYNALALLKEKLLIFYEVCHSCQGCILLCPEKALCKMPRPIGVIESGMSGGVTALTGRLNTGEVSGVPIIKELMALMPDQGLTVIDCPPGSACSVMESIRKADFCLLVAEPTLFGAHNLKMVYELVTLFKKPFGVVLNKCLPGENPSAQFCSEKGLNILAKIPYDPELGQINADGLVATRESKAFFNLFGNLLRRIQGEVPF